MIDLFKIKEIQFIAIISLIIFIIILFYFDKISNITICYETFLSISASLFGFLITTLSILIVFPDKGRMKILNKHNLYRYLFDIVIVSIILQFIIFIFSLIGNLFSFKNIWISFLFIILIVMSLEFLLLDIWIIKKMIETMLNK